ncbi:hypothetical protein DUNSADRAFT_6926 [Dunaliella salina]|uniref:Uncharacterized protein n=1 Tax=Dunaliella salina TaxID=3046 RepID=A0ABQ7GMB3_DUNSA|nr:hypothetical protein DUNSADRAFT_6926 [Dunaliella salina]|eukprot:KAF5835746.1 hypothetical protein DUNSADRAFT_6926 [Dunaliella salina]
MPSLVLMKGHPGSGKSTLASSISRTLGVPLCDKDDIRDCFQPYVAKGGAEIDWNGLSYQFGATLVVVECVCSNLEEWKWRTDVRGAANLGTNQSHKPEGWEQLQDLLARYHGCWRWSTDGSTLIPCLLVVDTAGWPKVVEDQVLIKLAAHLSRAGSILSKQPELHVVSERYRDLKDLMAAAFPERIRGLD